MAGTYQLKAMDAGFAVLVDTSEYKYTVINGTSTPFEYFLNPAVYGSNIHFVRFDGTQFLDEGAAPSFQYLDDRYGVGASYVEDFYGRQPFGSNLPGVFIPLNGGTPVDPILANLQLTKAYTSLEIIPYLIVRVYEWRLASYEYYTYLGSPFGDGTGGTIDPAGGTSWITLTKPELVDTLATELYTSLNTGGQLHAAYKEFTGLDLSVAYDVNTNELTLGNMAQFDGEEIVGEKFESTFGTGHLTKPDILIPGLTKVVGQEYYGFKPMRGVYTVFAPEKFNDLTKALDNAIAALTTLTAAEQDSLLTSLRYRWNDFYRGQDQQVTVKVPPQLQPHTTLAADAAIGATTLTVADTSAFANVGVLYIGGEKITYTAKTATTFTVNATTAAHTTGDIVTQPTREYRVNVFFSAFGTQMLAPTVSVEDPANPGQFIEVAGQAVNMSDAFSYVTEEFDHAKPASQRYTTGPYGAYGIVNDDGTVTYISDAYSV